MVRLRRSAMMLHVPGKEPTKLVHELVRIAFSQALASPSVAVHEAEDALAQGPRCSRWKSSGTERLRRRAINHELQIDGVVGKVDEVEDLKDRE